MRHIKKTLPRFKRARVDNKIQLEPIGFPIKYKS